MTAEQPVRLELTREQTGTLLGALAWAMGALQIMRDRGALEEDEDLRRTHDTLVPRLEALVQQVGRARQATATTPALEQDLEAAYTAVREAFETWIHLTAMDTLSAAVAQRLQQQEQEQPSETGEGEPGAGEQDTGGRE